jgi:hypothetical protein
LGGNLLASEKVLKTCPGLFRGFFGHSPDHKSLLVGKNDLQIEAVQDSIKELKAESVTFEAELMKMNRPSEIAEKVKKMVLN